MTQVNMSISLSYLGFGVVKSKLQNLKKLKDDLTIQPFSTQTEIFMRPCPVKFYYEYDEIIYIPKQVGFNRIRNDARFTDANKVLPWPSGIVFMGELKELELFSQHVACRASIRDLLSCGGSLLSLPTGTGKTACALYIMSQMKVKVAVVVHKQPLLEQWRERIEQFLPAARIGVIQGTKVDVVDKDIVIIMLQSITKRDYEDANMFQQFGLVVLDEVHHLSARVFSQVFHKLTRPFMLGLSATLKRKDRTECSLEWFIGPISMEVKLVDRSVRIQTMFYKNDALFRDLPTNKSGNLNFTALISLISEIEERNLLIVDRLQKLLAEKRNIIVMSDRRSHCILLQRLTKNRTSETGCVLIGGSMPTPEVVETSNIFFATYSLCAEGLDIPKLDCLILATPKSDVVQATGRIMRYQTNQQNTPLVIDIVDHCGPMFAQYMKRKAYYNSCDFSFV
jgi:superfamily II DNA or RNA helicase